MGLCHRLVHHRFYLLRPIAFLDGLILKFKQEFTQGVLPQERKRRRREIIAIFAVLAMVALLTLIEFRVIQFDTRFPISNTIPMFILININLLLLILLFFLVFRNLFKLFTERRKKVMGAKLRTRLVAAFISLTLLPATVLFFFSINFIKTSLGFWFNVPVEQALENAVQVGRQITLNAEERNRFFIERIAYQIQARKLLDKGKKKELDKYIEVVQTTFDLNAVEVYSPNFERTVVAAIQPLQSEDFTPLAASAFQKKSTESPHFTTVSRRLKSNELMQTIGTIPLEAAGNRVEGYVVTTTRFPRPLTEQMDSIIRGMEEYDQIKLLKNPVQTTYYITLSIVALLVVFIAVWFGIYLSKSISIPIKELADGTVRVAEGDLAVHIAPVGDDEIGQLVDSFNRMTRDLLIGREQLELSSRRLQQQNIEIEARRRYMEIVLQNVSAGVISLDGNGLITTINTAAERMLQVSARQIIHQSYKTLLTGEYLNRAEDVFNELAQSRPHGVQLSLRLPINGVTKSFLLHMSPLENDAGQRLGTVMVFDDLTELEKAQRMAAWREVARRIAHEVKNPLTPISLSAQRLKRKYSDRIKEPVFDECTQMIIDHVELIRNLVNEFSAFARFPTAKPKPCVLGNIIEETVALYREGHPGIRFSMSLDPKMPALKLDRQQIKQALINLVDNAVAATGGEGEITISSILDAASGRARLEVTDDGEGFNDKDKSRIFEPNFSTKNAGTGLGLTIVQSIITDHGGTIRALDNAAKGARFVIELPVR